MRTISCEIIENYVFNMFEHSIVSWETHLRTRVKFINSNTIISPVTLNPFVSHIRNIGNIAKLQNSAFGSCLYNLESLVVIVMKQERKQHFHILNI